MKNPISYKTTKKFVLGPIKINTDKSYFYYHALATKKSMIERVKKLLWNYNISLHKHNKPHKGGEISNISPLIKLPSNTWVGETEEQIDVNRIMDIAVIPTSPLILRAVRLREQLLYIGYGSDYHIIDPNISVNAVLDLLARIPGQEVLRFNVSPLIVIYRKNVDTRNE